MGGVGSGGKRTGSGPKPKTRKQRWLDGNAGKRIRLVTEPAVRRSEPQPIVTNRLTEPEAAYWTLWAPLAISLGTLTTERVPGFELLCQVAVERDTEKGQTRWLALTKELGIHLSRFGLTADGKVPVSAAQDDEEEALAKLLAVK